MQTFLDVKMGHYLITGFIKMEITYICNDYSLDIDGKEFVDIDYDKQKEIYVVKNFGSHFFTFSRSFCTLSHTFSEKSAIFEKFF